VEGRTCPRRTGSAPKAPRFEKPAISRIPGKIGEALTERAEGLSASEDPGDGPGETIGVRTQRLQLRFGYVKEPDLFGRTARRTKHRWAITARCPPTGR